MFLSSSLQPSSFVYCQSVMSILCCCVMLLCYIVVLCCCVMLLRYVVVLCAIAIMQVFGRCHVGIVWNTLIMIVCMSWCC